MLPVASTEKKAGGRVVEIVDRVLQFLEDVFLLLAVARDVGNGPDGGAGIAALVARPHPHAQPLAGLALVAADTHFLLQTPPLAGGFQQPVDRLRYVGIADENPLDRTHLGGVGRPDQVHIGLVGIDHAAAAVGHQDAVEGAVDKSLDQGIAGILPGKAQDAGGEREQREHPDGAEDRQQDQDIKRGIASADLQKPDRGPHQHHRDQQHQPDRSAALRAVQLAAFLHVAQIGRRHDSYCLKRKVIRKAHSSSGGG